MPIERETFSAGKYSQVRLSDGSRLFVEVLNEGFTVRNRTASAGSGELIWSCNVLKKIRGVFKTSDDAKKGLELILNRLETVSAMNEVEEALSSAREDIKTQIMGW